MLNPIDLLLVRVDIPFEIWIILVICSGGIYFILWLIKREPDAEPQAVNVSASSAISIQSLLIVIAETILRGGGEEELNLILSKISISDEQKSQFILMVTMGLQEFSAVRVYDDSTLGNITKNLISNGMPDDWAASVVVAIVQAIAADQS